MRAIIGTRAGRDSPTRPFGGRDQDRAPCRISMPSALMRSTALSSPKRLPACPFSSSGGQRDGQGSERPQRVVVVAARPSGQFDAAKPFGHHGEQCFCFQTCHVLAHALVDAHAETDMTRGISAQIESIRIFPRAGVPIGRSQEQENLLARRHHSVAETHIAGCGSEKKSAPGIPAGSLHRTPPGAGQHRRAAAPTARDG
jgi:hypothetical protein